jgi:hypothetical protein
MPVTELHCRPHVPTNCHVGEHLCLLEGFCSKGSVFLQEQSIFVGMGKVCFIHVPYLWLGRA